MTELLAHAARYVSVPSVSGEEQALCDVIERELRAVGDLEVTRVGDNLVARTIGALPGRLLLAGHLDTVPGDATASELKGDTLVGLGACDMKGSLAVMASLATSGLPRACELTWVFYAREEIAREHSGLLELHAARPELLGADVAVVMEPTSCAVEAGCQGLVRARVTLRGARAHTARPWRGRNAIHRLGPLLTHVAGYRPRVVDLDGVTYTEQLQAVDVEGGVSGNVVPDLAVLSLNHRVAPDRDTVEAAAWLRDYLAPHLEDGDGFEVVDAAEPAAPSLAHPALARLVELTDVAPRGKLGYTDVSMLAGIGVPAANFGAGDPELAHHAGEFVTAAQLTRCFEVMAGLLASGVA